MQENEYSDHPNQREAHSHSNLALRLIDRDKAKYWHGVDPRITDPNANTRLYENIKFKKGV